MHYIDYIIHKYVDYKRGDTIPQSHIAIDVELRPLSDELEEALRIEDEDKFT
jgi:hypothetical protein